MKSPSQFTISPRRRALITATVAALCSAGALAQTSSPSASASQKNPPADYGATGSPHRTNQAQPTTATGSGYHSGTASADADAAREINAQNTRGAAGVAGAPTGRDSMMPDKLAWGDRRFVHKAAEDGKAEVQLAQLATQRASHAEVKSFAQKLVDQHSKVNSELMAIAAQKSVKLDDDDDQDRSYKRLSRKSGLEFDQEFVEHTIDEHEKSVRMFEKASTDAKDSEVRAFAAKHLEHLRSHLTEAQGLRQAVMPTGRMDASGGRATPAGPTTSDTRAIDPTTTDTNNTNNDRTSTDTSPRSSTPNPDAPR